MAVTLRLARHGQKNRPYYRIVVSEKGAKRDGKFIEAVGVYNPLVNPPLVTLKEERIRRWIKEGAQVTKLVSSLISKAFPGLIEDREKHRLDKIRQNRRKRKERAKAGGKKAAEPAKKKATKKKA